MGLVGRVGGGVGTGVDVIGGRGNVALPSGCHTLVHGTYGATLGCRKFASGTRVGIALMGSTRVGSLGHRFHSVSGSASILSFPLNRSNMCSVGPRASTLVLKSVMVSLRRTMDRTRLCNRSVSQRLTFLAMRSVLRLLNCSRMGGRGRRGRVFTHRRRVLVGVNLKIWGVGRASTFVAVVNEPGINGSSLVGYVLNRGITVISSGPRAAHAGVVNIGARKSGRVIFVSAPNFRGTGGRLSGGVGGTIDSNVASISTTILIIRTGPGFGFGNSGLPPTRRGLVSSVVHHGVGTILIVGGVSLLRGGRSLLSLVVTCAGTYSFRTIMPLSTEANSKISLLVGRVGGFSGPSPRCFSGSSIASRPRGMVITRVVHRGLLHSLSGRIPRNVTISLRHFMRHSAMGNRPVIRVRTMVVYRGSSRGNVVVNGNNTYLGGVNAVTHHSVRRFFNVGTSLGL